MVRAASGRREGQYRETGGFEFGERIAIQAGEASFELDTTVFPLNDRT
jgi:hypothetical protein